MAGTCCAIEMEPRTLNQGQLNRAREVAVDVVQNMESSQASSIFIEGMKPVVPVREVVLKESTEKRNGPRLLGCAVENLKKAESTLLEQPCQCLCSDTPGSLIDSPNTYVDALKEPLSAPF